MAQEDEPPPLYIYSSYFYCGGGPLSRVDEITAETAPIMDGLVEDGTISGWGWYAHHTGGGWQRLSYHTASSMEQLIDGSDAIQAALQAAADDDDDADDDQMGFGQICYRHDDYIWEGVIGSGANDQESNAGFSTYHVCDLAKEERADEIIKEHAAPILNKLVEEGKLTSWGWSSHSVGGRFRKLQTMTASDHKTLLAAREEAIEAIYAGDSGVGEELSNICGSHVDYMWDIVH
ncbi:MAG: hypothetical protein R3192_15965 [Woeseiaceae bacterium]|nr:hypothetical protein [Woeseiaceae bacterium]